MIKVIVGYKLVEGADLQPVLLKLRSYALTFPGFVSAENLVNSQDSSLVSILYTWESIDDWKRWENTEIRKQILKEAAAFLQMSPRLRSSAFFPRSAGSTTPSRRIRQVYAIVDGFSGVYQVINVGASGFEPPTSASRTLRANQAALRPVAHNKPYPIIIL